MWTVPAKHDLSEIGLEAQHGNTFGCGNRTCVAGQLPFLADAIATFTRSVVIANVLPKSSTTLPKTDRGCRFQTLNRDSSNPVEAGGPGRPSLVKQRQKTPALGDGNRFGTDRVEERGYGVLHYASVTSTDERSIASIV